MHERNTSGSVSTHPDAYTFKSVKINLEKRDVGDKIA